MLVLGFEVRLLLVFFGIFTLTKLSDLHRRVKERNFLGVASVRLVRVTVRRMFDVISRPDIRFFLIFTMRFEGGFLLFMSS